MVAGTIDLVEAGRELSRQALVEGLDALSEKIFARWEVMPPRPWAETIRRMPSQHGTTQGFSFTYAPYQLEPYLEIFNPRNREVDFMWASRTGKTEVVANALGRTIHQNPCRIGVMWPVAGDGKLWSKDDFMGSLVEPTPEPVGDAPVGPISHHLNFVNVFSKWDRQLTLGRVGKPPQEVLRRECEPVVKRLAELMGPQYLIELLRNLPEAAA